jgi:hypothetical protein
MCNRFAIQCQPGVVSRHNCLANSIFTPSPLHRNTKSDS